MEGLIMLDIIKLFGYAVFFVVLAISPFAIGIGIYIWIAHYIANAKYKNTYKWLKDKKEQYKINNSKEMKARRKAEKNITGNWKEENWTPVMKNGRIYLKYSDTEVQKK
jgi:hypothetical protein